MKIPVVALGILDPIAKLFGIIMGWLYSWIGNYGVVVIILRFFSCFNDSVWL